MGFFCVPELTDIDNCGDLPESSDGAVHAAGRPCHDIARPIGPDRS